ncbi:MAG: integrase family protein [Candidatus Woesebacteria bacterium GW2011_GWC1_42_9]|nr:MAG: integrase family protein [Candidatus Woesebacteria bacterium GW2011_GWC1_42_9]
MNISEHTTNLRKYMEFRKYSPQSISNYCSAFTSFLAFFEKRGVQHPDKITSNMVIEFLGQFKEPATHSGYHSAIKVYYEKVAHTGIEKFKYIERPKRNKKLPIVLSVEEIQRMFDVCHNLKHKAIFALLYSCGLRVSEVINLKWSHIDRSRGVINILAAKGNKDRQVPINDQLLTMMENYWREFRTKDYVFAGQCSEQYSTESILQVIKQLAAKANIKKRVYTHLIRHCSFTHLVENGTDINIIQKLAGHSNVKTTHIYTHISHNLISKIQSPLTQINLCAKKKNKKSRLSPTGFIAKSAEKNSGQRRSMPPPAR